MTRRTTVPRLAVGLAAAALVAWGCQPAASPSPTVPAAIPGGSASSTAAVGRITLTIDPGGPIIGAGDGPPGMTYSLPAAAARERDGGEVLFIAWFGAGDVMITLNRSTDGRTWETGTTEVFDLPIGSANPGPIPAGVLQLDDGTWLLYGWSADPTGSSISTWRASAPRPEGPWKLDADDVLEPGAPGSWDSMQAAAAAVVRSDDGYLLWYEGEGPGSEIRGDIGLATSTDGLVFEKEASPVIRRGICGDGTSLAAEQVQVERVGDEYVGIVGGVGAAGQTMDLYGTLSPDGRTWTCDSTVPLLTASDVPGSQGFHTMASLPLGDGRIGLIVESLVSNASELWWATVEVAAP